MPTVPGSEGLIKNSEDAVQVRLAVLMQQDWCRWLLPQRGLVVWAWGVQSDAAAAGTAGATLRTIGASVKSVESHTGLTSIAPTIQAQVANQIGFPIMIKATAGGGGRGMRLAQVWGGAAGTAGEARSQASMLRREASTLPCCSHPCASHPH